MFPADVVAGPWAVAVTAVPGTVDPVVEPVGSVAAEVCWLELSETLAVTSCSIHCLWAGVNEGSPPLAPSSVMAKFTGLSSLSSS